MVKVFAEHLYQTLDKHGRSVIKAAPGRVGIERGDVRVALRMFTIFLYAPIDEVITMTCFLCRSPA